MSSALYALRDAARRGEIDSSPEWNIVGMSDEIVSLRESIATLLFDSEAWKTSLPVIVVCAEDADERRVIADGIYVLAVRAGYDPLFTETGWGGWARSIIKGETADRLHIVLGQHEKQREAVLHSAIHKARTRIVFVWPLSAFNTDHAPRGSQPFAFDALSRRPPDGGCHLLCETIRRINEEEDENLRGRALTAITDGIIDSLLLLCGAGNLMPTLDAIRIAAGRAAQHLLQHVAFRQSEPVPALALQAAMFPPLDAPPVSVRRLWVEGDTDRKLFQLAENIAKDLTKSTTGLLDGIAIDVLGGSTKVELALARCRPNKDLELFLFDNDEDGRLGKQIVEAAGRAAIVLSEKAVVSVCHRDWVLEDLISVSAVDAFYKSNPGRSPAREEITYRLRRGRRIVVGGDDKQNLIVWLSNHATASDLLGVIHQVVLVRQAFALAPVAVPISEAEDSHSRGLRPEPWWFIEKASDSDSEANQSSGGEAGGPLD